MPALLEYHELPGFEREPAPIGAIVSIERINYDMSLAAYAKMHHGKQFAVRMDYVHRYAEEHLGHGLTMLVNQIIKETEAEANARRDLRVHSSSYLSALRLAEAGRCPWGDNWREPALAILEKIPEPVRSRKILLLAS